MTSTTSTPYDAKVPTSPSRVLETWRVTPGKIFNLSAIDPSSTPGVAGDRKDTENEMKDLRARLSELQDRLMGEQQRSVLLVLQAMDTGGKDGTAKNLYLAMNPVGVEMSAFSVPSEKERAHDFLWRIHQRLPERGHVGIFNRSHYEDVLAVRVRNIAPKDVWEPRFGIINDFEHGISMAGTTVVKVMLHISKDEQKARLQARIDRPEKRWKFRMGDLEDRELWADYQNAYSDMLSRTSSKHAPWYVVPADRKWYRDWAVLNIMISVLEQMEPKHPLRPDLDGIIVP